MTNRPLEDVPKELTEKLKQEMIEAFSSYSNVGAKEAESHIISIEPIQCDAQNRVEYWVAGDQEFYEASQNSDFFNVGERHHTLTNEEKWVIWDVDYVEQDELVSELEPDYFAPKNG